MKICFFRLALSEKETPQEKKVPPKYTRISSKEMRNLLFLRYLDRTNLGVTFCKNSNKLGASSASTFFSSGRNLGSY